MRTAIGRGPTLPAKACPALLDLRMPGGNVDSRLPRPRRQNQGLVIGLVYRRPCTASPGLSARRI